MEQWSNEAIGTMKQWNNEAMEQWSNKTMNNSLVFELKNVSLKKWMRTIFTGLNWAFHSHQNWAIVGPNGAGKTILAEAIAGKGWVSEGHIDYALIGKPMDSTIDLRDYISYVTFTEQSRQFNYANFYYQQRFQSTESDQAITVEQYLFGEEDLPGSDPLFEILNIAPLLKLHFIKLSNGQTRRVRLAKALRKAPKLLIVDNFFTGLDQDTRDNLAQLLNKLTEKGLKIILVTSSEMLPQCITHVLEIDNFAAKGQSTRAAYQAQVEKKMPTSRGSIALKPEFAQSNKTKHYEFDLAVQMKNVNLSYGNKPILSGINWTIQKGEKWALTGPNGSGKTSLLSLIYADNPQAYSQKIRLFDRPKGSGESIWQIKQKIGFISPELFTYFRSSKPALEVAATGYTDTLVLQRKISPIQQAELEHLFEFFSMTALLRRPYHHLSTGEQRMVLIIRSLIKNAPMLIMDEPFQGLDAGYQKRCLELLEAYCHDDRTLIYVSHYEQEIPSFVDQRFHLHPPK